MAGFFKKLFTKFSRGSRIDWDELEADLSLIHISEPTRPY